MDLKILCLSALLTVAAGMKAQQQESAPEWPDKNKEIWVGVHDLSPINISLGFKHRVGEQWFMSYRVFNLAYSTSIQSRVFNNQSVRYSVNLGAGIEKRHAISERLLFFHGPELAAGMWHQNADFTDDSGFWSNLVTTTFSGTLGYRIGMLLQFGKSGFAALHVAPALIYSESSTQGSRQPLVKSKQLDFWFYNNHELSVGLRF